MHIESTRFSNKYIQAWPLIPVEELHASSVQHPRYSQYRWLLHTRRVPVERDLPSAAATDHNLPKCVGVGIAGRPSWLCRGCMTAFCRPEPGHAILRLANWSWDGRRHPQYYNLNIATKSLLGLAIMVCRFILPRHSEQPDDQEKGFVGNTILLTQPRPEEIIRTLPPPDDEASKYLSVCFNSQKMTTADVGKHRALKINSEEYIRCAHLGCLRGSPPRRTAGAHTVSRRCSSVCHPPECATNGHTGHI